MAMRMSGLMSGMDTESIVQQLVEVRSTKVTKTKNEQTKLEWKQDIWKDLNKKLKNLQSKLNNLRFTGDYVKKKVSVSDSSVASVMCSNEAVDSVQSLEVKQLAKTAYLTGDKVSMKNGASGDVTALTQMQFLMNFSGPNDKKVLTLYKPGIVDEVSGEETAGVDIELTAETTISDVLNKLKEQGLNASFDANQKRFFVSAKEAGKEGNFMLTGDAEALRTLGLGASTGSNRAITTTSGGRVTDQNTLNGLVSGLSASFSGTLAITKKGETAPTEIFIDGGTSIADIVERMQKAGINAVFDEHQQKLFFEGVETVAVSGSDNSGEISGDMKDSILQGLGFQPLHFLNPAQPQGVSYLAPGGATYIAGQDARIELNGATFTSTNNVFEINGLTITTLNTTDPGKSVTLTTSQDTDGIYDMIKDFLKTYNEVINEMDKLYNAKVAKDFEPLTDEQKAKMSETEIEKYEQKIKDALLRKDNNLNSVSTALKEIMLSGFSVNGKKMYLTNFGIGTLSYFNAADNEKNAFHIDGDSDDENTSFNEDVLKKMIATDPDSVVSFFTQLTMKMYNKMNDMSKSVEGYRSYGSFFDDKKMKSDYTDYTSKIKTLEDKLADYEDKWYKKFSKMETAMAKMQKNVNALTSMLGTNN